MIRLLWVLPLLCTLFACDNQTVESGVSRELAEARKENISNLEYALKFNIPDQISEAVTGSVQINFATKDSSPIILDFLNSDSSSINSVVVNGSSVDYEFSNEHIIIPARHGNVGANSVIVEFTASDQSLNRRDKFLYSLLVPDRARTLFPCFDQPNLKARFSVQLSVPNGWKAVSNGAITQQSGNTIHFAKTEPLSTYLFSIVAGELEQTTQSRGERSISLYHRESDPDKIAQIDTIFSQVFASLDWLEEYTAIKYPFAKYDLIILPGFQYGGMEHVGATLYTDKKMFLSAGASLSEELARSSLIAHETAHMWFGDYVTMNWFNDVWTKEVFANYFASQIVAPQFPNVNHELNFLLSHAPSAYAEDRTAGSNPIQQELDNMQNAGLVYGNIIYKKSPIVMNMLVEMVGKERFREGIQRYLNTYAYSNATWDNLIEILDQLTDKDLLSWSNSWVKERSMPTVEINSKMISQSDPLARGVVWEQQITFAAGSSVHTVTLDSVSVQNPVEALCYIPNVDGRGYGFFKLDSTAANYCLEHIGTMSDELMRGSVLITLYENLLNNTITPNDFMAAMVKYLPAESNQLLFSEAIGYARSCNHRYDLADKSFEDVLWSIYDTKPNHSLIALRTLMRTARSQGSIDRLHEIWSGEELNERDAIALSYQLAILTPKQASKIVAKQLSRITNSDRRAEYSFISPAVSDLQQVRDSVFNSLLDVRNRGVEPWVQTSLSLLNHSLRQTESLNYIRTGLDELVEVQQTGDIFFPANWCASLLGGHNSIEAAAIVRQFIVEHPTYPQKLAFKILQGSDHLKKLPPIPS